MSKQNLIKLMQAAAEDETLQQQLQKTESYEAIKNVAREQGFDLGDLSEEEARRTAGVVTGEFSEELSDEELELVAGGVKCDVHPWMNPIDDKGKKQGLLTDDGTLVL